MADRFADRDRGIAQLVNEAADRYNDVRHADFIDAIEIMGEATQSHRQGIRKAFGPRKDDAYWGSEYFSIFGTEPTPEQMAYLSGALRHARRHGSGQEFRSIAEAAAAEDAIEIGNRWGRQAADYQVVPARLSREEQFADRHNLTPYLKAPFSAVEGVLAGLASPTEDSQGFLPEVVKGLSAFADPEAGVDKASLERLYGGVPGMRGAVLGFLTDPMAYTGGARSFAFSGGRPSLTRAFGTQLVDRHGNVIRQLRAAEPVMPLGLPAPAY